MMRNPVRLWAPAMAVLVLFAVVSVPLANLLHLTGTKLWVVRSALWFFGALAAALVYFYQRARARDEPEEPEGSDDLGLAIASAHARLATAGRGEARIGRLPLVLVLGPSGGTKTSVVAHSGLDAELLSGEVMRGDVPIPTEPVNVWFANGTIVLEAGGRLLDDNARWLRLARLIRPSRLAAAVGRGRQAPRVALVCFGCDELQKPGASEAVPAAARRLRTRLAEISQELGIRLPVYVLFTKSDRLPQFAEYVRNLSTEEAQQVLGATIPWSDEPAGIWAEAQSKRLHAAFDRLVHRLAAARLDVLSREADLPARGAAYEFPRELRKTTDLAVQFLVDVCRPSQLGLNPFLRGFYFTGVRPVYLTDVAALETPAAEPMASGATSVFNARMLQQSQAASRGGRKVPQWLFLRRFFREVMLTDDLALRVTGGGARVDLLRRSLIGAAAAAFIFVALGMTVSFVGNRKLVRTSVAAATEAREVGGVGSLVGEEDLQKLDALRERTALVTRYEREGRPLHLAWGLYTGHTIQPLLHHIYFARFDGALWRETQDRLLGYLRGLPAQPDENSDFGRAQDALAAHLLTTSENGRATPELLTPVLLTHARPMEGDTAQARVQRQFAFFAEELPHGNPYDAKPDEALVERTQQFLRAFGPEAYYRALVYEGGRVAPAVSYNGPQSVIRNAVVVPGAFTVAGYRHVQTQLDSVDRLIVRYQWIYGAQPPAQKPRREELAQLYQQEYVRRWQDYLAGGSVERFSSPGDAAVKLSMLGAPTSPLFAMLATASRETAMDSMSVIGKAFQPLHMTVPPAADARGVTAAALTYANSLNMLASNMNLLGNATGPAREQAMGQASAAAAEVKREAAALAAGFSMAGDAALTSSQLQRLLRQPADFADGLVSGLPTAELNAAGRDFCGNYGSVARAFPFSAHAGADASPDDVNSIFKKDEGLLWSFYNDALQLLLTQQGRPKAGARVRSDFARFFARAAEFTAGAYRGNSLALVFDFQPEIPAGASEVVLDVDGQRKAFTPTNRASQSYMWEAERSQQASLVVVFGGERITVATGNGPWAPFRVFFTADWRDTGPYRVEWRIPGRDVRLVGTVSFESGVPPLLRPSYTGTLSQCVSQITN